MIIGFIGQMGSGKTTAAKYLEKEFQFTRVNFKDALRLEITKNFPDLIDEIKNLMNTVAYDGMNPWTIDRLFDEKPAVFRALMQNYGTEVRRGDDEYYWTRLWSKSVGNTNMDVTVDDVRFQNEADCVRNAGGKLIRIVRTDQVAPSVGHKSETELANIMPDEIITVGPGEHDQLYKHLDNILNSYGIKKEVYPPMGNFTDRPTV